MDKKQIDKKEVVLSNGIKMFLTTYQLPNGKMLTAKEMILMNGETMVNSVYLLDLFLAKDTKYISYRMSNLGIKGQMMGDKQKYWNLNTILRKMAE